MMKSNEYNKTNAVPLLPVNLRTNDDNRPKKNSMILQEVK